MKIDQAKIREPLKLEGQQERQRRVSAYTESYKGEFYNIAVDKLIPFKNQARKHFDQKSLDEMASTIAAHGIRQPLTVLASEENEGKYEVLSGERRWRAAESIGLKQVPCLLLHDKEAAEEVALIENVQRKDLHPLELMSGLQNLLNRKICTTHEEIASKIGMNRTSVVEILGLSRLPVSTQEMLLSSGVTSRRIMRTLLKLPESQHKSTILNACKDEEEKGKIAKKTSKRNKILSVYMKDDGKFFFEASKLDLSKEQRENMVSAFSEFLDGTK